MIAKPKITFTVGQQIVDTRDATLWTIIEVIGENVSIACVNAGRVEAKSEIKRYYQEYYTPPADNINSPPHYTKHSSGVECITITECFNFNLGNSIKYIWQQEAYYQ